jgi:filamentous hemagglutinin
MPITEGGGGGGFLLDDAEIAALEEGATSADIGRMRVGAVKKMVGRDNITAENQRPRVPGVRTGDIDLETVNSVIEVGGPSKAFNLGSFGSQLKYLKGYASITCRQPYFYYAKGTPDSVLNLARKWLGANNVIEIQY